MIPDPVAKVSLVKFQQVPAKAQELDQLIRWQVRKAAPFAIEEAQVSYVDGAHLADGQEFIVSLARRDIVAEYEALCAEAGAHAGLIDLSTFNVINAVLGGSGAPSGDWLLVNVAPEWASMAILRGQDLVFFRSRGSESEGTLADLVHQTAMYYEDRLSGAGFGSRHAVRGFDGWRRANAGRRRPPAQPGRAPRDHGQSRRSTDGGSAHRSHRWIAVSSGCAGSARGNARARSGGGVIRTNLATRPFYNERLVNLWLLLLAAIVGRRDRLQRHARAVGLREQHGACLAGHAECGAHDRASAHGRRVAGQSRRETTRGRFG